MGKATPWSKDESDFVVISFKEKQAKGMSITAAVPHVVADFGVMFPQGRKITASSALSAYYRHTEHEREVKPRVPKEESKGLCVGDFSLNSQYAVFKATSGTLVKGCESWEEVEQLCSSWVLEQRLRENQEFAVYQKLSLVPKVAFRKPGQPGQP
jgi:hypothetical protein